MKNTADLSYTTGYMWPHLPQCYRHYVTAVLQVYMRPQCCIASIYSTVCGQKRISCMVPDLKIRLTKMTNGEAPKNQRKKIYNMRPMIIHSEIDCLKAPWWVSNGSAHEPQLELEVFKSIKALPCSCYIVLKAWSWDEICHGICHNAHICHNRE